MKSGRIYRLSALVALLSLLCPAASHAVSFGVYDDFDDGDFDGWAVVDAETGAAAEPPDVVASPDDKFSLRGVGSGYWEEPGLEVHLTRPFLPVPAGALKIEMRAISGPEVPNAASLVLFTADNNRYRFAVYGQGLQQAQLGIQIPPGETYYPYPDPLNLTAGPLDTSIWHDYAWTRDAEGWWSLSIDGEEVAHNFCQDMQLTSFDRVGLELLRNQTEIEWVRVTATPVAAPEGEASSGLTVDPNVLNLKSEGTWITCHIELGVGLDAGAIDINTVMLNGLIPAELHPAAVGDHDENSVADLMVKFDRAALQAMVEVGEAVPVTVTGQMTDGTFFAVGATIKVIDPGKTEDDPDEGSDPDEEPDPGRGPKPGRGHNK